MMTRKIIIKTTFIIFILMISPVLALTQVEQNLVNNPGILPNQWTYRLKRLGEDVNLIFTFNKQNKAELQYKYALKRLGEAQKMQQIGEHQLAFKAENEYNNQLQIALNNAGIGTEIKNKIQRQISDV